MLAQDLPDKAFTAKETNNAKLIVMQFNVDKLSIEVRFSSCIFVVNLGI